MDVEALTQDEAEAAMHELVRLHMYEEEGWQGWGRGDGRGRGGAEHGKTCITVCTPIPRKSGCTRQ